MNVSKEQELLLSIAKGDEKAFRQLFNIHHEKLGAFIYRLTRDKLLTEELVQDVFVKIWNRKEQLPAITSFDRYLFAASRNLAMNAIRDISRKFEKQLEWEKDYQITESSEGAEDFSLLINEAIDRLPNQQKKVYLLSKHEKYKYEQIAEKMDISRETVKKYLQLAKQSILAHLRGKLELFVIISFLFR